MILDGDSERADGKKGNAIVYTFCIASGVAGAGYFMLGAKILNGLPLSFYVLLLSIHQFIINFTIAKMLDSRTRLFSVDKVWGAFGFFDPSQLFIAFVLYGIFATFFGGAGYVLATVFFSPVVCATALLGEPFGG